MIHALLVALGAVPDHLAPNHPYRPSNFPQNLGALMAVTDDELGTLLSSSKSPNLVRYSCSLEMRLALESWFKILKNIFSLASVCCHSRSFPHHPHCHQLEEDCCRRSCYQSPCASFPCCVILILFPFAQTNESQLDNCQSGFCYHHCWM
jgi:hypothetical protein